MNAKLSQFINLIMFLILGAYLLTSSTYAGFGDALGFLLAAVQGLDLATNATSHFLYTQVNYLAVRVFAFADPVMVLTGVSLVAGLLTLIRFNGLLRLMNLEKDSGGFQTPRGLNMEPKRLSQLIATIAIGLSFTWWRQVVSIEVYAFNMLLIISTLFFVFKDIQAENRASEIWVGVFFGLSLLTHIQHVLLLPLLGYYVWTGRKEFSRRTVVAGGILMTLVGFLFIPPIFLETNTIASIFFDNRTGGSVLGFQFMDLVKGFGQSLGYFAYNFHVFVPLFIYGCYIGWKKHQKWLGILLLAGGPYWGFAMRYAVTDNYVFYLLPYFLAAIVIGWGIEELATKWTVFTQWKMVALLALCLGPLTYWMAWKMASNLPQLETFESQKAYKGGLKYYLWPGMRDMPDPLNLAKTIYRKEKSPIDDFERYPVAVDYLKKVGELE